VEQALVQGVELANGRTQPMCACEQEPLRKRIDMKHSLKLSVALAGVAAMGEATAAQADSWATGWMPKDGIYGSVKGGASWVDDHSYTTGLGSTETKLETGTIGSVAIGARNGMMRYELEGLRQDSDVKSHSAAGVAVGGSGESELTAAMANVYVDFGERLGVKPYIGGGIGYGHVNFKDYSATGTGQFLDDSDNVLAYQGIAGVAYDINPCWAVTAEYRYIGTNDAEVATSAGTNTKVSYDSNNVLVGLRYTF